MKHSIPSGKFLLAMTLAVFAAPQVTGAEFDTTDSAKSVYVRVTDLNLTSPDGIDVLYQRLRAASRQVCGNTNDLKLVGSLKQLRLNQECYDATMAQALANANFPNLAQVDHH